MILALYTSKVANLLQAVRASNDLLTIATISAFGIDKGYT